MQRGIGLSPAARFVDVRKPGDIAPLSVIPDALFAVPCQRLGVSDGHGRPAPAFQRQHRVRVGVDFGLIDSLVARMRRNTDGNRHVLKLLGDFAQCRNVARDQTPSASGIGEIDGAFGQVGVAERTWRLPISVVEIGQFPAVRQA